jgi:hypothetical protein
MIKKYWLWIVGLTLLFPIVFLITFVVRFDSPLDARNYSESLIVLGGGLVASLVLFFFIHKAGNRTQRIGTIVGFVLILPLAMFGSFIGGMLGPIGVILYAAIPVLIGAGLGFWIGGMLGKRKAT